MKPEMKVLNEDEIREQIKELPGWKYENGRILKKFEFQEFMDVVHLINDLAPFFEEMDHHADMEIEHRKIVFKLWRFDIGMKVTNYDFITARKIEELASKFAQKQA